MCPCFTVVADYRLAGGTGGMRGVVYEADGPVADVAACESEAQTAVLQ